MATCMVGVRQIVARTSRHIAVRVVVCLVASTLVAGMIATPSSVSAAQKLSPLSSARSASRTPLSLRSAIARSLAHNTAIRFDEGGIHQLAIRFAAHSASLSGPSTSFSVGAPTLRRGSKSGIGASSLSLRSWGAEYGTESFNTSYRSTESGIEQRFSIASRPSGAGSLVITVPISGATARVGNSAIQLMNGSGVVEASYSGLRVTDSRGRSVPSSMSPADAGTEIAITVHDAGATYPLTVDPTWNYVELLTGGSADSQFGASVAISGDTALVGAEFESGGPAAFLYTFNGSSWSETAEISAPAGAGDFAIKVALAGTTAVIAAPTTSVDGNSNQGAIYVYTETGGTWNTTSPIELSASDGEAGDEFGGGIAISSNGSEIVATRNRSVGSGDWQGAFYVYSVVAGAWTQTDDTTQSFDEQAAYGWGVSISGPNVVVGAPDLTSYEGAAYAYSDIGGTWSQDGTAITESDPGIGDFFGLSVAVSGSTAVIGAPGYNGSGTVYVFSIGGGSWDLLTQDTPSDLGSSANFGDAIAMSGSAVVVGAPYLSSGGVVYNFVVSGGGLIEQAELESTDAVDIGHSVSVSGTEALAGDPNYFCCGEGEDEGAADVLPSGYVQPLGSIPLADMYGGGDGFVCSCAKASTVVEAAVGKPINTATGDAYESTTDLTLPGPGIPLSFVRTYDAQEGQAEVTAGEPVPPLGYGWTDNLGMSLSYDTSSEIATVTEADGAQITFAHYSSDPSWCTSTGFCPTAPRYEATLSESGSTWTYSELNGSRLTYTFTYVSTSGDTTLSGLSEIVNDEGDSLTSEAYTPGSGQTACPTGDTCVVWISSASGRELVLATTNTSKQLVKVFDANSSLAVTFAYSDASCTWGDGQVPDLCTATDPGSLTTSYTYTSSDSSPFDYDMYQEISPGDTSATATANTYNSYGQVTEQADASGDVLTLTYSGTGGDATANATFAGGTTTVANFPEGMGTGLPEVTTTYTYSSNVLISEVTGAGATAAGAQYYVRDPSMLMPFSVTDADGNSISHSYSTYSDTSGDVYVASPNILTTTDGLGNTTVDAYTPDNQVWCSIDAADILDGIACPSTEPSTPPAPGDSDPYLGATITYYNSLDQETAVTDPLGNTTAYFYTDDATGVPNGLIYCVEDPSDYQSGSGSACPSTYSTSHVSGTQSATFDSAGDEVTSTNALGDATSYAYAYGSTHPGLVSSVADPDGTKTTYSYNAAGQVTESEVTDSSNSYTATTLFGYNSMGLEDCEVAPMDVANGVTCSSSTGLTSTTYDSAGRVELVTNPIGGTTQTTYDEAGNPYCTVEPEEYAAGVRCPAASTGDTTFAGATIRTYDADDRLTELANPLGGITTYTYDAANNVLSTTVDSGGTGDPAVVTAYTYNADNEVTSTTVNPSASSGVAPETTLTSYDPNGNAFCTVSANAVASGTGPEFYQCPTWQPSWIAVPPNPASLYVSDPTEDSQANNVSTTFTNADGDVVQSTDADAATTVTGFNDDGLADCAIGAADLASWLSAHSGASFPYACPNPPLTTAPTGTATSYTTTIYDADGHVLTSTDPIGNTTTYTYDPAGNTASTTDPRDKETTDCYYWQNAAGQCAHGASSTGGSNDQLYSTTSPVTTSDPDGETTTFAYYPGGTQETATTPAGTSTYDYDPAGDLLSTTYSGTASAYTTPAVVAYTYNVDGSRSTMSDATGITTYAYDAAGDVTSTELKASDNLLNTSTSYSYFTTGTLKSVTYPAYGTYSAPTVAYAYDPTGAMASSTDWLGNETTYSHDEDQNPTAQDNDVSGTYPSGTSSTAYSNDDADQLSSATSTMAQTCGGPETLTQSFSGSTGSLNASGQVTEDTSSYAGSCSDQPTTERNYSYDADGRVVYQGTTAQGTSANTFAYDASGDPTTISSHDSLGNFDTYTQSFDNAGEVTGQTPVEGSDGASTTYTYDSIGDQVTATTGSTTTGYGFNQIGQMASVTAGATTSRYLYSGDGLNVGTTGWHTPDRIDPSNYIYSISCTSSSFCAVVDDAGDAMTYVSGSWYSPSDKDGTNTLSSVSCKSSSYCVAVDESGEYIKYSGDDNVWSAPASDGDAYGFISVSCPSTTLCVAVDQRGKWATYNGTTWSAIHTKLVDDEFESISCASTTMCMASDGGGKVYEYNGSTWNDGTVVSPREIKSISCTTTTFCEAVGEIGVGYTYNGTSWSAGTTIGDDSSANAVSCSSSSMCVAGDLFGDVYAYNGTSWSSAQDVDGEYQITGISCPTTSFCEAVDGYGSAIQYTSVSQSSQMTWDTNGSLPLVLSDNSYDYIYGPTSMPVEQVNLATSSPTFMTHVASDDAWLTTNASGDETGFWSYDAFGNLSSGSPTSAFGNAGQYTDATSGLTDMRARWYYSQTGSFTTRDPDFAATDTAYTYADDDPVNASDPTGLDCGIFSFACAGYDATAGGIEGASQSTWNFVSDPTRWEAVANYGAGIGNAIVSTVTFGSVHIAEPYACLGPSWAFDVGEGFGYALSLVGGGVAFDAIRGALFAGDATEAAVAAEGGALSDASSAAFDAADNAGDWTVSAKHLVGSAGNWAKFAAGTDPNALAAEALRSPDGLFLPNSGGAADSFIVKTDLGQVIGTQGQTWLKVVVSNDGQIITAYPVKG